MRSAYAAAGKRDAAHGMHLRVHGFALSIYVH
jgi:hypothetical protein